MRRSILVAVCTTSLVACVSQPTWSTIEGTEKILALQHKLEKPSFALEKVVILRMSMDGRRLEVSSVSPTVIVAEPARGNRTIFNLSNKNSLVLFTRDGRNIKGYREEIPLSELIPGKSIRFPVAQDPGEVVEKILVVDRVLVQ
jgi:hypothetical protein